MGKGRGGERSAGERSTVAGQNNWEKLGQKGRFPLIVITPIYIFQFNEPAQCKVPYEPNKLSSAHIIF